MSNKTKWNNPVQPVGLRAGAATPPARVNRKPYHPFNISFKPFQLQPFMCAPILIGETLTNLNLNARAVSEQVKSPITGWWLDTWIYYVPFSAMGNAQEFNDMLLNTGTLSNDAADTHNGYGFDIRTSGVNWYKRAMDCIVPYHFRDGDDDTGLTYGGMHLAHHKKENWAESFFMNSELPTDVIDQTPTADIALSALEQAQQAYDYLKQAGLMQMDFADYAKTFGVTVPEDVLNVPTELRYQSTWSLPANTVNPADVVDSEDNVVYAAGKPSSVLAYSIQDRADKNFFCRKPGFIVGVACWRPKVYLTQTQPAVCDLVSAKDWLPAVLMDDPATSLKKMAGGTGPFGYVFSSTPSQDYWFDVRDIFLYGDHFTNRPWSAPIGRNPVPETQPDASGAVPQWWSYPNLGSELADPEWKDYFVSSTLDYIHMDGVVDVTIKGTQVDHT